MTIVHNLVKIRKWTFGHIDGRGPMELPQGAVRNSSFRSRAMPRTPRKFVFDPAEVGVYHGINRCVRRAFLCGTDAQTGKCYEHRKGALRQRLEFLAGQFAVDVLGFAMMSTASVLVAKSSSSRNARPQNAAPSRHTGFPL